MKAEVLDVCCGGKMFYFQPDAPYLCGVDIRKGKYDIGDGRIIGINPDVQCDFRDLPFPDKSFNLVIYDPPHLLRCGDKSSLYAKYGRLPGNWQEYLAEGFKEAWRVLKPSGTLIFKWSQYQLKSAAVLSVFPVRPLLGTKRGHAYWYVFYKPEKEK